MIWESTTAMTVIDLLVIGLVIAMAVFGYRLRFLSLGAGRNIGPLLILLGACVTGAFYLADLVSMHLLPIVIGEADATAVMTFLHLELSWLISLSALGLFCSGFLVAAHKRKRYESELQATEARYKAIVDDQAEMIVRWERDGIRTWVNDQYCEYFGQSREEMLGSSFLPLIADANSAEVLGHLESLTPEDPVVIGEYQIIDPSGRKRWQAWTTRAIFDENGSRTEFQSVGRDIHDAKRAEEELKNNETWLRNLVESTTDWVWEMGADGIHRYSNRQVEAILGYTRKELYAMRLRDLVHPDDFTRIEAELPTLISKKLGWNNWTVRFLHKNGSYRYVESNAAPVLDESGTVTGFRGVDRDVTFKTLLAKISRDLLETPANGLDACISTWLAEIGEIYLLDRASLWWLNPARSRAHLSHDWTKTGPEASHLVAISLEDLPWSGGQLLAGENVVLETLDDLPSEETRDRAFFEQLGVASMLAACVRVDGQLVGCAAFWTMETSVKWPEQTTTELSLLAETLAGAHLHAQTMVTLSHRERDLARSGLMAKLASYSYRVPDPSRFPDGVEADPSGDVAQILGFVGEQASFEFYASRIFDEDRERMMGQLLSSFEDTECTGTTLHYRMSGPNESVLHIEDRVEIDRDPSDGSIEVFGTVQDISDRMRNEDELREALENVSNLTEQLKEENVYLREEVRLAHSHNRIVGADPKLKQALIAVEKVAPTDAAVMVLGETGTGKELIANSIHELSERSNAPLISVNCAALSASLIESELFGHEQGAFTGAQKMRKGRFEVADGGTLFLDEIGELPLELQAKILRVLQTGTFERLGSTDSRSVNVRLIAATNRDLKAAVDEGQFRADLYYRISTFPIHLPALRQRRDDIPLLAEHFVKKHAERLGKQIDAISARSIRWLREQSWPGNVRELEGFIERALISSTDGVLELDESGTGLFASGFDVVNGDGESGRSLQDAERSHINRVLESTGWIISGDKGAASLLGIPPSTLRSKMKRLGLTRPEAS